MYSGFGALQPRPGTSTGHARVLGWREQQPWASADTSPASALSCPPAALLGILYEDKERQDFIFTIYHWWQAVAIFTVYLGSSLPMKVRLGGGQGQGAPVTYQPPDNTCFLGACPPGPHSPWKDPTPQGPGPGPSPLGGPTPSTDL